MSSKAEILREVTSTLAEMFAFPEDKITPSTRLVEDLGLDSIDAIDMAVRLEKRTGFEFKGPDMRSLKTVDDIVELLWGHRFAIAEDAPDEAASRRE